jgi:hypothetical protein
MLNTVLNGLAYLGWSTTGFPIIGQTIVIRLCQDAFRIDPVLVILITVRPIHQRAKELNQLPINYAIATVGQPELGVNAQTALVIAL